MPAEGPAPDSWTSVETADGSRTLVSARYGQTLHSAHGAVAEASWVFLRGSGVKDRLGAGMDTRVLEIGFGTGLNFLLTADAACGHGATVRYVALERTLPPRHVVETLGYGRHLARPAIARQLAVALPETAPGAAPGTPRAVRVCGASLDLRLGEATAATLEDGAYDAVFHDGFSPGANPELWSETFLAALAAALAPGGVLVTYTVAGAVRRALNAQGLDVEKRAGPPGGKRQMLWARKPSTSRG